MSHHSYAIVAVNTVAVTEYFHRLIEICIVRITNEMEVERFTSLLNPQTQISSELTEVTGLDKDIVQFEPVFREIAEEILRILEGATLVSFSDLAYRVLRSEFKKIGYKFVHPSLYISKLIHKNFPEESMDLRGLSEHFGIPVNDLNRCDGMATWIAEWLDKLALNSNQNENHAIQYHDKRMLHQRREMELNSLERKPGVYYFKDSSDAIIYVGKAVRLRDRVKSHFNSKLEREYTLCEETDDIDFVYTGSNLIAELLESDEIKLHHPKYNIAQKKPTAPFIIASKENKKGYLQLSIVRKDYPDSVNEVYYNRNSVAEKLMEVCKEYNLCPKFSGFHKIKGRCNHEKISNCPSACMGEEDPETYNARVKTALKFLESNLDNFAIKLKGRKDGEMGFVLVRDGVYAGFGFVGIHDQIASPEDFENYLVHKTHSYHTTRIIDTFIRKPQNKSKIIYLDSDVMV
ncbi:exonuclease domain-containing protein [Zobellia laminariae]|uniref:exonuclease domain-containing protein n=1 Tax=Zobellia laminariae TaxID=248906 RepID=UPI003EF1FAC8